MRRRHLLNRVTGSTMCGIRPSEREGQFMRRDFWNKYINCKKCAKYVEHQH